MNAVEIRKRDFLARAGIYHRGDHAISFPGIIDPATLFPTLPARRHTNVPLGAGTSFVTRFLFSGDDEPTEVHPSMEHGAESGTCVMVGNWHSALFHPRDYVRWLLAIRSHVPCDTVWYAPAAATPSTVAVLVYSGFALFDFTGPDLRTAQHRFCTPEGDFPESWMQDGGCGCAGCDSLDLGMHNRIALRREVHTVRRCVELGQLRELLEGRCRMHPAQVAILRHIDAREHLEAFMPVVRGGPLLASSTDALSRIEVRRFARRVAERYRAPDQRTAVLLPCSARKPYSRSKTHRTLAGVIRGRGHELIVTSPLGLVPRELEGIYPAAHYDVPVTGYWDREELAWAAQTIAAYFTTHPYQRVIAHLEGGALQAAEMAASQCGILLENTCDGSVLGNASLGRLDAALAGERSRRPQTLKGVLSWQFAADADTVGVTARPTPGGIAYMKGKTILFTTDTATGLVRPTHEGWALIPACYRVIIDDFLPQGDILVPGIVDADEKILEGDEVFVTGPRATATGRAAMGAYEMKHAKRGIAIRVRKVKSRSQ